VTLAEVAFRKLDSDGNLLVGLAMNRTHCRTTSFDFLVDPQLVACGTGDRLSGTGFFVGAYCMENEYILARKMRFCGGVAVGDIVVFPNTAGYFMHFMESRSHLFDLPKNLVIDGEIVSGGTDIELN
jgi:diaminopimelate decarboxylase